MADKKIEPFWTGPGYRGEYQCPHGVGHGRHVHGCCPGSCCQRDDFPLNDANLEATRAREGMQKHRGALRKLAGGDLKSDFKQPKIEKPLVKKSKPKSIFPRRIGDSSMVNFHVAFSRQFGNAYRFVRFHVRLNPRDWRVGNQDLWAGPALIFKMYCLGPFGIQWG